MTDDDLAKLSELVTHATGKAARWRAFTAEQMREYARAAVAAEREACARLCDELIGTRAMARHCADAIRAKEK